MGNNGDQVGKEEVASACLCLGENMSMQGELFDRLLRKAKFPLKIPSYAASILKAKLWHSEF